MSKHTEALETFRMGLNMGGERRWAAVDAIEALLEDSELNTVNKKVTALRALERAVADIPGGDDAPGREAIAFEDTFYGLGRVYRK